jgi:tetratricopeptide (TPR) repeat protein
MRVTTFGRLTQFPRRRWERALAQAGGSVARKPEQAAILVIGGGAAARPAAEFDAATTAADSGRREVLSERAFLRRIGLLPALAEENRPYTSAMLAQHTRLGPDLIRKLALLDIIEGDGDHFGFVAMKAANAARKLIADGVDIADLAHACQRLRDELNLAAPLAEVQIAEDDAGKIVLQLARGRAELSGQMRLDLEHMPADVEPLLSAAAELRDIDPDEAEGHLRRALAAAPQDPEIMFELGSLLCDQKAFAEGIALLSKAAALRPGFADAWYNIGCAYGSLGRSKDARKAYERAIAADPTYADPLYNLGMLAVDAENWPQATRWLDQYLALDPVGDWAVKARKGLLLARLATQNRSKTG